MAARENRGRNWEKFGARKGSTAQWQPPGEAEELPLGRASPPAPPVPAQLASPAPPRTRLRIRGCPGGRVRPRPRAAGARSLGGSVGAAEHRDGMAEPGGGSAPVSDGGILRDPEPGSQHVAAFCPGIEGAAQSSKAKLAPRHARRWRHLPVRHTAMLKRAMPYVSFPSNFMAEGI